MFERCQNCGGRVILEDENAAGVFCSSECREWYQMPGFCQACLSATVDAGSGNTLTHHGFGVRFYGNEEPCPDCGSSVRELFTSILYLPVFSLGKYRVKSCGSGKFFSRRIGTAYVAGDAQPMLEEAAELESIDRARAIAKYEQVARLFPGTAAGNEARRNVQTLTAHCPGSATVQTSSG